MDEEEKYKWFKKRDKKRKEEIQMKIDQLRTKLNEMYELEGNIEEVLKISQELDEYIILAQQEIMRKNVE